MTARLASIILLFGALGAAAGVLRSAADGGPPDFNRHVRPILADNCLHCHGVDAAKRQGNLRLDDEASVLARGTVVPGNAAASPLIARIESTDPRRVMPPPDSHRSLTEAQRRTLARWIDAGAKFDAHWSFVAPVRTATPAAENPIDAIVSRRLRSEGLALSPQADRSTLLRRVTLDLTGLPPTPAEIDAFLADTAPGAYERVIDRLLASPRYG